jgi:hypothetical protein
MVTYGSLVIPGVPMNRNPLVFTENGVVGEGGGGRFIPPPGPSPGSRGSLERSIPGVQTVATGENAHGYPSEVDFGLVGTYTAEVTPSPGVTDAQVLQELVGLLDAKGVPARYDVSTVDLSINIPDNDFLDWRNTDTGLNFTMSTEGLTPALFVPEPATWTVMGMACGGVGLISLFGRGRARA